MKSCSAYNLVDKNVAEQLISPERSPGPQRAMRGLRAGQRSDGLLLRRVQGEDDLIEAVCRRKNGFLRLFDRKIFGGDNDLRRRRERSQAPCSNQCPVPLAHSNTPARSRAQRQDSV